MVTKQMILQALPPVKGTRLRLKDDQQVRDIMREVIAAHNYYAQDYRRIAGYFSGGTDSEVARRLFDFCKKNIRYEIEGNDMQTTRSPGAILAMGRGDCKHYASFIGGVLDAIGGINWKYRFASYDLFNPVPGHVYVVVNDGGRELWVDPVLNNFDARNPVPVFVKDKKIHSMALERLSGVPARNAVGAPRGFYAVTKINRNQVAPQRVTISGIGSMQIGYIIDGGNNQPLAGVAVWAMGTDRVTVTDNTGKWSLDTAGSAEIYAYKPGWTLARANTSVVTNGYRWFFGRIWDSIGVSRKNEFASGLYYARLIFGMDINDPPFTLTVDGEPYDLPNPAWMTRATPQGAMQQILPQGVQVNYPSSYLGKSIPASMIRPVVNVDRTVTIQNPKGGLYEFEGMNGSQTVAALVANDNFLLKVLACVCGAFQLSCDPFPDCYNVQREYENILSYRNINMALSRQTKTFAGQVVAGIGAGIAAIGKGFIKFIGVVPRTAFLQLVRLNVKGMATHLYGNLQIPAQQPQIQKKWEGFGGDYGHLLNAARDGSGKRALGSAAIGVAGADDAAVAAAIAAAAPLIALLASWLKSQNNPELNGIVDTAVAGMNKLLTAAGEDPIAVADSYGGKPVIVPAGTGTVTINPTNGGGVSGAFNGAVNWVEQNPMIAAAAGAGIIIVAMGANKRRTIYRRRSK
jgi:hypothetical protein